MIVHFSISLNFEKTLPKSACPNGSFTSPGAMGNGICGALGNFHYCLVFEISNIPHDPCDVWIVEFDFWLFKPLSHRILYGSPQTLCTLCHWYHVNVPVISPGQQHCFNSVWTLIYRNIKWLSYFSYGICSFTFALIRWNESSYVRTDI